jgi:uncharacterized membrane protein
MGDAFLAFVGVVALLVALGLPVMALVLAIAARAEVRSLRDEVQRLDRLIRTLRDGTNRPESGPAGVAAPPATVPPAAPVPAPPAPAAAAPPIPPAGPPAPPPAPPPLSRPLDLSRARATESGSESLEVFLGGRVFLVAGIVTALLGLGWFFKVAIDRGWIGPGARVAIGAAAGVAALFAGDRLRGRGLAVFGQGLMGGGLGALYVTTFFACVRYGLLDRPPAYAVVLLLTGGGALLAAARNAPLLAYLGFLGGFLAPAVLSPEEDRLWALGLWLAILDAGALAAAARRSWKGLDLMATLFSAYHFSIWLDGFYAEARLGDASAVLAMLTGLALATSLAPPVVRREKPHPLSLVSVLLAGLFAILAGASILYPEHRRVLGAGVAGLAACYVVAARLVASRCGDRDGAGLLLGLALAAAAVAVPYVFEGRAVAPAWAVVGILLFGLVAVGAPRRIARGGTLMLVLAVGEALCRGRWIHDPGMPAVGNAAFACVLAPGAALVGAGILLRRVSPAGSDGPAALLLAGTWTLALAAGAEAWQSVAHSVDPEARGAGRIEAMAAAAVTAGATLLGAAAWRRGADAPRALALAPAAAAFLAGMIWIGGGRNGEFTPVLNAGFLCGLGTVAAALAAGALSPRVPGRVLQVGALAFLFAIGTAEIASWGAWSPLGGGTRQDAVFRAQVAASVAWAVYAAALLGLGFLRERADLRWTAIVLFGVTLVKVFLHDMARLDVVYRVFTFLVLGLLLVVASRLYQRRKTA